MKNSIRGYLPKQLRTAPRFGGIKGWCESRFSEHRKLVVKVKMLFDNNILTLMMVNK